MINRVPGSPFCLRSNVTAVSLLWQSTKVKKSGSHVSWGLEPCLATLRHLSTVLPSLLLPYVTARAKVDVDAKLIGESSGVRSSRGPGSQRAPSA